MVHAALPSPARCSTRGDVASAWTTMRLSALPTVIGPCVGTEARHAGNTKLHNHTKRAASFAGEPCAGMMRTAPPPGAGSITGAGGSQRGVAPPSSIIRPSSRRASEMSKSVFLRMLLAASLMLSGSTAALALPPSPQSWKPDIEELVARDVRHQPPQHGVMFVGSSSIRFWAPTLQQDFPGIPVIDRGFGGSAIADSTYYADRIIIPYQPRVIVMYAGDNDIEEGCTPRQVLDEFKVFVARVRRGLPDVAIVYISIKPSLARWPLWPQMREANREIARWTRMQKRVAFVDVSSRMLGPDGKPRANLFREDGLHMAPAGYAIWITALEPVLARYGFATRQARAAGG